MTPREEEALELLEKAFPGRSFMQPELERGGIEYEDEWGGTSYLPVDVDPPPEWEPVGRVRYIARLSAPGYMDATEWIGGDDPLEVATQLAMMYADW